MSNELIIVKQLPMIEEHLKERSEEIEKKVENAKSLVCTEENVKTIKEVRTELNKDKTGVFTGAYAINPVNDEQLQKAWSKLVQILGAMFGKLFKDLHPVNA